MIFSDLKEKRPDVNPTAAGQQPLLLSPAGLIVQSDCASSDFHHVFVWSQPRLSQPARSKARRGTRSLTSDAFLRLKAKKAKNPPQKTSASIKLFSDLVEKISNMNPHHLMRARRSSSERAPAPEESRTGRSPSPRSQIFPGSLPPAWCCCSNASSRAPRGARWSGDWTQRT